MIEAQATVAGTAVVPAPKLATVVVHLLEPTMCSVVWPKWNEELQTSEAVACQYVAYSQVNDCAMCTECTLAIYPEQSRVHAMVLADAEHPSAGPLNRLAEPAKCGTMHPDWDGELTLPCLNPTVWAVGKQALCQECMREMRDMSPENGEYYSIPLAEQEHCLHCWNRVAAPPYVCAECGKEVAGE